MSFQAIQTKYLGPTNTRGGRIKARCDAGSITVGWDHALNPEDNHHAAAKALVDKLGWTHGVRSGQLHDGTWAHVLVPLMRSRPKLFDPKASAERAARYVAQGDASARGGFTASARAHWRRAGENYALALRIYDLKERRR